MRRITRRFWSWGKQQIIKEIRRIDFEADQALKNNHNIDGKAEVVVTDGFTGNVVLKFAESIIGVFGRSLKRRLKKNLLAMFGAYLVRPAFQAMKRSYDYEEYGGVPLLGIDGISMNIIKYIAGTIANPISFVLNQCLTIGSFPDNLKIAKVCPVYKSGTKSELSNYRPISILNGFSKIFEKIIYNRIVAFIDKHNILTNTNNGIHIVRNNDRCGIEILGEVRVEVINN